MNLCEKNTYKYKIKGGDIPDLSKSSSTFVIENIGDKRPDLKVTL